MAGMLAATAVTLIILIAAGTFDPKPVGTLQWERPLTNQTIAAGSRKITWLETVTPDDGYSLRLSTVHQAGETDLLFGLVIGGEEDYLVTAVSPLGYAALWEQNSASSLQHSPFQIWPHVRGDKNEIWLDVVDGRVTIRINRELYWSGEVGVSQGKIGLWGESFGDTAAVEFPQLQLFSE
jgi:hypothetical protein